MFKLSNTITAPIFLIIVFVLILLGRTLLIQTAQLPAVPEISSQNSELRFGELPGRDNTFLGNNNEIEFNGKKYQADRFFLIYIIIHIIAFILPAVFYVRLDGKIPVADLGLSLPGLRYLFFSVCMFVVLLSGSTLLGLLIPFENDKMTIYPIGAEAGFLFNAGVTLAFIVMPAIAEEIVFRSVVVFKYRSFGLFSMCFISTIAFSMSHFSLHSFLTYILASVIFFVCIEITKSVFVPIALHMGFNFYILYIQDNLANVFRLEQNKYIFLFALAVIFMVFFITSLGALENIYYKRAYKNEPSAVKSRDRQNRLESFIRSILSPTFLLLILIYLIYAIMNQ